MKLLRWLDQNLENTIIFPAYFTLMALVAIGVVQRSFFKFAWHWGIQVCIILFIWFAWISCALNVKRRSHLSLNTLRERMPRKLQFALLMLDYSLWMLFVFIGGYYSMKQVARLQQLGSMIYGSEIIPKWVEPLCIPVAMILVAFRVLQCAREDILAMKRGERLKIRAEGGIEEIV